MSRVQRILRRLQRSSNYRGRVVRTLSLSSNIRPVALAIPKGVVLTHANLLANIRAMGQAMDASSTDVFVSWLPLYHDMGLIGAWLGCLHFRGAAVRHVTVELFSAT